MPGKRGFCFMDPPRSRELGVENLAVTTPLGIGNFGRFYLVIGRLRFIRFRYRSHIRSISNGMRASRTTKKHEEHEGCDAHGGTNVLHCSSFCGVHPENAPMTEKTYWESFKAEGEEIVEK